MSDAELSALRRAAKDDPSLLERLEVEEARVGNHFLARLEPVLARANSRSKSRRLFLDDLRMLACAVLEEGRVWGFAKGRQRVREKRSWTTYGLVVEHDVPGGEPSVSFALSSSRFGFEDAWAKLKLPEMWWTASVAPRDQYYIANSATRLDPFEAVKSFLGFAADERATVASGGFVSPRPRPGTWRSVTHGDADHEMVKNVDARLVESVLALPDACRVTASRRTISRWCAGALDARERERRPARPRWSPPSTSVTHTPTIPRDEPIWDSSPIWTTGSWPYGAVPPKRRS